jgi:Asp-tRNA(Asn)/Glu-tRNA(Gln) amidotransferase A subunit family amidase
VKTFALPNMQHARLSHAMKITSEFAMDWDGPYSEGLNLEAATRVTVGLGSVSTSLEVLAAEKIRRYFGEHVKALFREQGIDAVVTPTTPVSAPKIPAGLDREIGESNTALAVDLLKFAFLGNFLGLPGVACPVGFDKTNDDMPLSILFTGQQWEGEGKVMRLAAAVEEVVKERGWNTREVAEKLELL